MGFRNQSSKNNCIKIKRGQGHITRILGAQYFHLDSNLANLSIKSIRDFLRAGVINLQLTCPHSLPWKMAVGGSELG